MNVILAIAAIALLAGLVATLVKNTSLRRQCAELDRDEMAARRRTKETRRQFEAELARVLGEQDASRKQAEAEIAQLREAGRSAIARAQQLIDKAHADCLEEADRIRLHYEGEARRSQEASEALLADTRRQLGELRKYDSMLKDEDGARRELTGALKEAEALREEARALLEQARTSALDERSGAVQRSKELRDQAEALLTQATREAGRIVQEATRRAEQIGGDAYVALRDKNSLEAAVRAIQNVVDGYGDRYVIPTRSVLDGLAADFGHTTAGEALRAAREHTRRMVEQGEAAECDYVEPNRRQAAVRFVIDAFNGRVDAILSRSRHDNHGTLQQEIRDAFSLVSLNGQAFRNARLLPAFLDARLAELRWAVVVHELRLRDREEQRRLQEQIREEEKVRREYERAIQDAAKEEAAIKEAIERARIEADRANAQDRSKLEEQLAELSVRLAEAEAKNQRAVSLAQQTRSGNVYIISNIGSFGETVFKIGMTRRLEPLERIKELSDASVPFEFDIHAMIRSDDAPALERALHGEFDEWRINKVNYRKEFFRLPLERIKNAVAALGLDATFTLTAEAREFRESQALERMTAEERRKYQMSGTAEVGAVDE